LEEAGAHGNHHVLFGGFSSKKEVATENLSIRLIERFLIKNRGLYFYPTGGTYGYYLCNCNQSSSDSASKTKNEIKNGTMA